MIRSGEDSKIVLMRSKHERPKRLLSMQWWHSRNRQGDKSRLLISGFLLWARRGRLNPVNHSNIRESREQQQYANTAMASASKLMAESWDRIQQR